MPAITYSRWATLATANDPLCNWLKSCALSQISPSASLASACLALAGFHPLGAQNLCHYAKRHELLIKRDVLGQAALLPLSRKTIPGTAEPKIVIDRKPYKALLERRCCDFRTRSSVAGSPNPFALNRSASL